MRNSINALVVKHDMKVQGIGLSDHVSIPYLSLDGFLMSLWEREWFTGTVV